MIRIPTHRQPTHPGETLREKFLNPTPYQRVNDMIIGRRSITPSTAPRLTKFFNMSASFWTNLQMHWDMYFAQQDEMKILKTIEMMQFFPVIQGG